MLTEPPVKKIDLHFPLGLEVTARNLKGVTIKDALDAIHKQFKKRVRTTPPPHSPHRFLPLWKYTNSSPLNSKTTSWTSPTSLDSNGTRRSHGPGSWFTCRSTAAWSHPRQARRRTRRPLPRSRHFVKFVLDHKCRASWCIRQACFEICYDGVAMDDNLGRVGLCISYGGPCSREAIAPFDGKGVQRPGISRRIMINCQANHACNCALPPTICSRIATCNAVRRPPDNQFKQTCWLGPSTLSTVVTKVYATREISNTEKFDS